jgi:hypothetical protein
MVTGGPLSGVHNLASHPRQKRLGDFSGSTSGRAVGTFCASRSTVMQPVCDEPKTEVGGTPPAVLNLSGHWTGPEIGLQGRMSAGC